MIPFAAPRRPLVALAGNPNSGKSTLFNALTRGHQATGNWPGQTLEKKSGHLALDGVSAEVVDLPGAYSLNPFSPEETVALDFLIEAQPDAVIAVLNAAQIERHLYLTVQLLELGLPLIVALNMDDDAASRGIQADPVALERRLGVPVVPTDALRGRGLDALRRALSEALSARSVTAPPLAYEAPIERELAQLQARVEARNQGKAALPARWLAVQLLEGVPEAESGQGAGRQRADRAEDASLLEAAAQSRARLSQIYGEDADTLLADRRYRWIQAVVGEAVRTSKNARETWSDRLDQALTHRIWGLPIFLVIMWTAFRLTTEVSAPLLDWLGGLVAGPLTRSTLALLDALGLGQSWVGPLFSDGVIAGVGGVLVFVPMLGALYLALALLEYSGYMARAAFVMDRLMQTVGLQGRSFMPMLLGFGCNVPALYATRALERSRDRILTGLLVPFMSCGARLPVYVLIAAVFFPAYSGTAIFAMYVSGILAALGVGILLRRTLLRGAAPEPLLIELPPMRMPHPRQIAEFVGRRVGAFVRNAGTLILAASVVLWILLAIPVGGEGAFGRIDTEHSAFAWLARSAAPAFEPLGFGSWEAVGALAVGFVAKEVVVSTLAQVYHVESAPAAEMPPEWHQELSELPAGLLRALADTALAVPLIVGIDLRAAAADGPPAALLGAVRVGFESASGGRGALAGLAFMVFVLLYTPCIATVAAVRHELGVRWMWLSVFGQLALAWVGAFAVFQVGRLVGG